MTSDFIRKFHIYKIILPYKNEYISKKEIIDKLELIYEANFEDPLYVGLTKTSEKTISRDVNDIQTFFGVEVYHKRNYGYQLIEEVVENEAYQKIIDKMELFLANEKEKEWSKYLSTEPSSLNPAVNIFELIRAIKQTKLIHFTYEGWYDDDHFNVLKNITAQPLHIKEANRAWYLIIYIESFGIKTICLDHRIKDLKVTSKSAETPYKFDAKDYFKNSLNILNDHSKPERIVLKVANHHFKYLVSKPIHHSQKILAAPKKINTKTLNYMDPDMWGEISVFLQPNHELIMEIFKFNMWVKVVEPRDFAEKIANHYHFLAKNYYPNVKNTTYIIP